MFILMIRPVHFGFNTETAVNNRFQVRSVNADVQEKAVAEFDGFVELLRAHGIKVVVVNDTDEPHTPDSIFPNNWVSFHADGSLVLYPMFAMNRRLERKQHVLEAVQDQFNIRRVIDLSFFEKEGLFLEGTGSMVLDRDKGTAYACLSPRTDKKVLDRFCNEMRYEPICFNAADRSGQPIYHTNVMMCVADRYAVVCMDSIPAAAERKMLEDSLTHHGKELIRISFEQMNHFAGNMLQVENEAGKRLLVMSSQAWESLDRRQKETLTHYNKVLHASITTIETNGGGSARCMMAEVF